GVGFCLGEGQEIDWIGHTEYSETRIEQLDHIFNLIGMSWGNMGGVPGFPDLPGIGLAIMV
ncbi:hypothetical protein, partial [Aeromonas caviae]|uniref:hypothetical protein n=1 Tax=Aeromonas caviae TaxID=648 RepID=UPI001FC7F8FA